MNNTLSVLIISLCISMFAFGQEQDRFPRNPILIETPGQLCTKSQTYRYLENIPYCERNVEKYVKNAIIQKYDNLYGFQIGSMNRLDFKIDHLIPLCAGGSNEEANLWPQHKSVYTITDPLESVICLKMQEGKLQQSQAVNLIIQAKMNINEVQAILKKINSL